MRVYHRNMLPRMLAKTIIKATGTFPSVVLTGPRQSGKTTLLKQLFKESHDYFNLEDPAFRLQAFEDPVGLISRLPKPVIIDEIQYAPHLLALIKADIDNNRNQNGRWLLTGSQQFSLMAGVTQSLAGRVAVLTLLPLSLLEVMGRGDDALDPVDWLSSNTDKKRGEKTDNLAELLLRGFYPELVVEKKMDTNLWQGSYLATYLERDVRQLEAIGDLNQFNTFVRACAVRTGQLLDLTDISKEVGVALTTVTKWLSVLQASYQVFLLQPYYRNLHKRLVKRPKLYFTDTGLAAYLAGFRDPKALRLNQYFGALFETFIVNEVIKRFAGFGFNSPIYFMKTRDGQEVDLVVEQNGKINLLEIKSTATITPKHWSYLRLAVKELSDKVGFAGLISDSDSSYVLTEGLTNYSWRDWLAR